jgi:hypothetical protein
MLSSRQDLSFEGSLALAEHWLDWAVALSPGDRDTSTQRLRPPAAHSSVHVWDSEFDCSIEAWLGHRSQGASAAPSARDWTVVITQIELVDATLFICIGPATDNPDADEHPASIEMRGTRLDVFLRHSEHSSHIP